MLRCPVCKKLTILPNARSRDECQGCRNVFRYWRKPERGLQAVLIRQKKLEVWQDRMIALGGEDREYRKAKRVISAARG